MLTNQSTLRSLEYYSFTVIMSTYPGSNCHVTSVLFISLDQRYLQCYRRTYKLLVLQRNNHNCPINIHRANRRILRLCYRISL